METPTTQDDFNIRIDELHKKIEKLEKELKEHTDAKIDDLKEKIIKIADENWEIDGLISDLREI